MKIETGYIKELDITVIFDFSKGDDGTGNIINFYYGEPNSTITNEYVKAHVTLTDNIKYLRHLVWEKDIPSPTVPEYVEHHRDIQEILTFIDTKLLA